MQLIRNGLFLPWKCVALPWQDSRGLNMPILSTLSISIILWITDWTNNYTKMNLAILHVHLPFMSIILSTTYLYVKQYIYYFYQSIMHFRSATTMILTFWPPLKREGYSVVSFFYCSPLPHTLSSVWVLWWHGSSCQMCAWIRGVHAVTTHWCPCCGPTTPCHGSAAYSLSGPLCCEWQWSKFPQEAQ